MDTEGKSHYEHLISYFKFLVTMTGGAITLLTGAAIYYSYNSLKDFKSDLKEEVNEIKSKALSSMEETKSQTNRQIKELNIEARELAISSTKHEVNKAFEENNIKALIENTAELKLTSKLGLIVSHETKKLEDIFRAIPILTTSYEAARWNGQVRKYIDTLYFYSEFASHELTRLLAKEFLLQKGRDYENYFVEIYKTNSQDSIKDICERSLGILLTINNLPKLFNKALVEEDLEKVTQAFISIRHLTNSDLPNFDFAKLRKLVNK
ncbi:MAG: hypothetical protein IPM86_03520 [Saprospiraceae bacterium]|nr:hypothetical protein [Saprospiraceae bacterium]